MPELPEVETLRRDAEALLVGRTIASARLVVPTVVRSADVNAFEARLSGATFTAARRRAKYLLLDLDSGDTLTFALAIYGQLLLRAAGQADEAGTLLAVALDSGDVLAAVDPSNFTRIWLTPRAETNRLLKLDALGPELLEPKFTPALLAGRLARRRARIKALLLDQHVVAGLGNIYVDEALWKARLHPARPGASLSEEEVARLHAAIQEVLRVGIADRGTTFHTYRDLRGEPGRHQDALAVFQRQGKPCPRCGTPIERVTLASRDTHLCPTCQVAAE